ncbi:hypothetical protein B7P43_G08227 [Cryptotermes secundus]|uniref:Uncharacterized protein n=1 Tax=Cryptotermes secundus TaxID=105785 RepID=A0A2J7RDI3_9NEOP|nr:hypothetical protein B7P43_G08227 [Cryptotermes secundus]
MLRVPHYLDSQQYAQAALYHPGRFLVLISFRGLVDPKAIVRLEGLGSPKMGIDSPRDEQQNKRFCCGSEVSTFSPPGAAHDGWALDDSVARLSRSQPEPGLEQHILPVESVAAATQEERGTLPFSQPAHLNDMVLNSQLHATQPSTRTSSQVSSLTTEQRRESGEIIKTRVLVKLEGRRQKSRSGMRNEMDGWRGEGFEELGCIQLENQGSSRGRLEKIYQLYHNFVVSTPGIVDQLPLRLSVLSDVDISRRRLARLQHFPESKHFVDDQETFSFPLNQSL